MLNPARDHNRRGLLSPRHVQSEVDLEPGSVEDDVEIADDHRRMLGLLHGLNLLLLPVIGRLLTLNRRLDQQMRELTERDLGDRDLEQT